ncbi:serine hydrolase domain-containing protein [Fodinibius sp. Rm-B-1B1-1]|uniref:serine hydrolase domain-containing protein n=1 Tax=Fodinibius alkaliphilus TaxID=3140241 RepID=UPI00315B032E
MRNLFYFILIVVITACGSISNPDVAVNNLQPRSNISNNQLDSIFQTLRYFPNKTQLSIALVDDSTTTFYGAIRENDTVKTISNQPNVFEIGSLSKVFTAALLADLATENKLQLNHPIQAYLDFPLHDSLQITFKELANHTSGLPRIPSGFVWESLWHMDNPYRDYNEEKLREYMSSEMELEEDGSSFQYSNIGAGILGYALTQIEGKSYEEMLQQKIFGPLDMQYSTTQRALVEDKLVPGLNKRGNPTTNWDLGAIPGAGAILSTAEDLAKYGEANFDPDNKVMRLQQEPTFTIDEEKDIGLGWFIIKQDSTTSWHWHNGGTGGYRSSMVLNIADKKGVIVLSNISAGHSHAGNIDSLSFDLLKSMEKAVEQSSN